MQLPDVKNQQVVLKGVEVWDAIAMRRGTATMIIEPHRISVKVDWGKGRKESYRFDQHHNARVASTDYVLEVKQSLLSDASLSRVQLKTARQSGRDICNAAITSEAINTGRESSGGMSQYYSGEFKLYKIHRLEADSANPVYSFVVEMNVEQSRAGGEKTSLSFTYEHFSETDVYKGLVHAKKDKVHLQAPIIQINAPLQVCTAAVAGDSRLTVKPGVRAKGNKISKSGNIGAKNVPEHTNSLQVGGCLFSQPKSSTNYRRNVSDMPADIPWPPAARSPESFDHDTGKSFSFLSTESPANIKSWYKVRLPKKGWRILKDDAARSRFGTTERLWLKSRQLCVALLVTKQQGPEPRKSLVSIYTYPGPGKHRELTGKDVGLSTGYSEHDAGSGGPGLKKTGVLASKGTDVVAGEPGYLQQGEAHGKKPAALAQGEAYWLSPEQGGGVFRGKKVCKACRSLLAGYHHGLYDYNEKSKRASGLNHDLYALRHEDAAGYSVQRKQRLKEEIKDVERMLRDAEKDIQAVRQLNLKAESGVVACIRRHCSIKGEDKTGGPGTFRKLSGKDIQLSTGYLAHDPDQLNGGMCDAEINGLTNPVLLSMPDSEKAASKVKSAAGDVAKGALGMFGGGNPFGGNSGPRMTPRPKGDWMKISDAASGITIQLNGWLYQPKNRAGEIRIAQEISRSPDQGAPHMMVLQNRDGRILRPVGYMIFELWAHWKLTITITRETYIDGQLVDRSVTRESTQWKELLERYKAILNAPGIWERFGLPPFGKLKGVIARFPLPDHFDPKQWSLVTQDTAKATMFGREVIKTVPFVFGLGFGEKGRLSFEQPADGKTAYQSAHGCTSLHESISDLMKRPEYNLNHDTGRKEAKVKLSRTAEKKVRMDADKWARILILAPDPEHQHLIQDFKAFNEQMQHALVFQASMFLFNQITGDGISPEMAARWNSRVTNLAIRAARRWQKGMNPKQQRDMAQAYARLSPALKAVFHREFMMTLSMNLFFDLHRSPAALEKMNDLPTNATPESVL
ncbi:hypothetical protein [Mariprofundus ferrooxydans]|uniref:Uncharacterized protein n=1 Tax=Mariprofundus ferrooxydans PV-1 TaxID=314345 RepID=Q0EWX1_9PROT|nr:hypothetical protein [Mariprofundus ferrooxydans]EAU53786.1 hypothetical protein SPV1_10149 [Mariprofundus ferrooxydans PV-1]